MPLLPAGFGGGGPGAVPFAIRSTDSLPAIFRSVAARDAYYAANAGDLAGALAAGRAAVGVGANDGSPVGVTAAWLRDGAQWVAIATNFTGAEGPEGQPGPGTTAAEVVAAVAAALNEGGHVDIAYDANAGTITLTGEQGISQGQAGKLAEIAVSQPVDLDALESGLADAAASLAQVAGRNAITGAAYDAGTRTLTFTRRTGAALEFTLDGGGGQSPGGGGGGQQPAADPGALTWWTESDEPDDVPAQGTHATAESASPYTLGPALVPDGDYLAFQHPADTRVTRIEDGLHTDSLGRGDWTHIPASRIYWRRNGSGLQVSLQYTVMTEAA